MRIGATLLLALLILTTAAKLRPAEYDESYSIFLTAGDPRPAWPAGIFHPADVKPFYKGTPGPAQIARDLRTTDVHPPLYFWTLEYWRRIFGPSWFAARMLSVLLGIASLATIAWIATLAEIPPASAMLITLFSYGSAYTSIIARGFALAQLLNLIGMALILSATQNRYLARRIALAAGLAFGAACFSNYLAVFTALAAFAWLILHRHRRKLVLPAALGFAVFLPAVFYFFHAQQHSRIGQFQQFSPIHATALLAKDFGAAFFGGLPIYAGHAAALVAAACLLLTIICTVFIVKNWRPERTLFALAVVSVPAGLFALGVIFNNTPIEIRYLAFAVPFAAILLAQTLPPTWRYILLSIQACAIAGLIFAPATMQPQAIAARQISRLNLPAALVLLPFGNDGVGIPGPFIAAAAPDLRLKLIRPNIALDLAAEHSVIIATIKVDDASKAATAQALAQLQADPCWTLQTTSALWQSFARTCAKH